MRGRDRFNGDEIAWIRDQLVQLREAGREEQKRIRARLRRADFHISDWAADRRGFTAEAFDGLLASSRIAQDDAVGLLAAGPDPTDADVPGGPLDEWVARQLPAALAALAGPRHDVAQLIRSAEAGSVPGAELDNPGLYALYADAVVWKQLGLGRPPDDRPLYVGKAEDSLVARDLRTHFRTGKTGWSSPRRSFAALLADHLEFVPTPRRPESPEPDKWTHYALEPDGDERLTRWMLERLRLAAWTCEHPLALGDLERAVMQEWKPPLNLTGVSQPWAKPVRAARAVLAEAAAEWTDGEQ